jgi:hypothetical protein
MKRITFEVSDELKIELVKECILTNVKIKWFLIGLFKSYLQLSEESKNEIRKKIVEKNS